MHSLLHFVTIREAADELELEESSIRRMIAEERLPARYADHEQIAILLQENRIKGVPGTGVRLIHRDDLAQAKQRRKRKRPSSKS